MTSHPLGCIGIGYPWTVEFPRVVVEGLHFDSLYLLIGDCQMLMELFEMERRCTYFLDQAEGLKKVDIALALTVWCLGTY
jgi:hypothetical protein